MTGPAIRFPRAGDGTAMAAAMVTAAAAAAATGVAGTAETTS